MATLCVDFFISRMNASAPLAYFGDYQACFSMCVDSMVDQLDDRVVGYVLEKIDRP